MSIPFLRAFLLLGSSRFRSTTNTTSALNSLHWLPIQQRINFKLVTLVHRSLHNAGPQYLSSLLHLYSPSRQFRSAPLNLLSQSRINNALVSRGIRHAGPSLWNFLPHYVRSTDSHTVLKFNLKNSPFLWCKHCWSPNNSIPELLIRHNHVDFASWNYIMLCYIMLCYVMLCYVMLC